MSEVKPENEGILVIAFAEEDAAEKAFKKLRKAKKEEKVEFWDTVVIRRDEKGRYFYRESKDMSTPIGAGIGAVIGALIGTPGGPAGIVLGTGLGASVGALIASGDAGLRDSTLERIGHALKSGNSALIVVSSQDYLTAIQEYAAEDIATSILEKLTAGISEHMVQGENAAYVITASGRSLYCNRLESDNKIAKLLNVGV